jgi:hypothetical protein
MVRHKRKSSQLLLEHLRLMRPGRLMALLLFLFLLLSALLRLLLRLLAVAHCHQPWRV